VAPLPKFNHPECLFYPLLTDRGGDVIHQSVETQVLKSAESLIEARVLKNQPNRLAYLALVADYIEAINDSSP
jgi:hypothetical protein